MNLRNRPRHTVEVEDPGEYREALEAADTLGLELRNVEIRGAWKGRDGAEPARGSTWAVDSRTDDARKWFYFESDRYETVAARPRCSRVDCIEHGSLELRFD